MNAPARIEDATARAAGPILSVSGVRKTFPGGAVALDGIDLEVGRGEFFTLLGPSGSGKTTTLRLIAGFDRPDTGRIELDGTDVAHVPPFARNINTVFQDYALFPHMTVAENVAYGLKAKGVAAIERRTRVAEALDTVRLGDLGGRKPAQLSGGQRQRVGLARAIVNRPALLLLDEPLGALDLQLRHHMQRELKRIQEHLGITFLYVTHDQEEALAMSSRVAVFDAGRIEQVGTPRDIYRRPASAFVAGFVGTSTLLERDGDLLVLRPEDVRLGRPGWAMEGLHVERARVEDVVFAGTVTRVILRLADGAVVESASVGGAAPEPARGEDVLVGWDRGRVWSLDDEGGV